MNYERPGDLVTQLVPTLVPYNYVILMYLTLTIESKEGTKYN